MFLWEEWGVRENNNHCHVMVGVVATDATDRGGRNLVVERELMQACKQAADFDIDGGDLAVVDPEFLPEFLLQVRQTGVRPLPYPWRSQQLPSNNR